MKAKAKTIDDEVNHVLDGLKKMSIDSEEYGVAVKNLQTLCEARSKKPAHLIEAETLVLAATNILGILLILHYEELNVVATKAISLVAKGRI
jgi:hypothetical protein